MLSKEESLIVFDMIDRFKIPQIIYKKYNFLKFHFENVEEFRQEAICKILSALDKQTEIRLPDKADTKFGYTHSSELKTFMFKVLDNHVLKNFKDKFNYKKRKGQTVSLDTPVTMENGKLLTILDVIELQPNPERELDYTQQEDFIDDILVTLSKEPHKYPLHIIFSRRYNGDTLEDIGKSLGISKEMVRQILVKKIYPIIRNLH